MGGVEGGPQGVPAVVSRGSRACGVTFRTLPTGSAPDHLGSPPITTDHHHFVGGWVGKGDRGGGGGTTGGPRGGEPGVPGVRGHAQVPPERFRTPPCWLTTPPRLSPLFCGWVGEWDVGGWGVEGDTGVPHVHTHVHTRSHTFTHVHTRSHICSHTFTRSRTFTHVHTRSHTFTHVHTRSHTFTHVHTRVHARSRTFTHVHARSLTFTYVFLYDVITWGENKSSTQCYSYCRHSSLNSTVNNFIIGTTVINTHAVTTRRASHQSPGKVFAILS